MKSLLRILALATAIFIASAPVLAQWQVPDNAVPLGRGAGTGFKSVGPGTATYCFKGNGASTPYFEICPKRESLLATRSYWVNPSAVSTASCGPSSGRVTCAVGSDSNTGLSNSVPFQTVQAAINRVARDVDFGGLFYVDIYVADGAVSQVDPVVNVAGVVVGSGPVTTTYPGKRTCPLTITGNTTTPANLTFASSGPLATVLVVNNACVAIEGMDISSSGASLIQIGGSSQVQLGKVILGATTGHKVISGNSSTFENYDDFSIKGNCGGSVFFAGYNSSLFIIGRTVTFAGNMTCVNFAHATNASSVVVSGTTFTAGAFTFTGRKYFAENGGNVDVAGAGTTYLPGTSFGATASGGTYDSFPVQVAAGGSGAVTLTGILQGNGASPFTALTSSTVGQVLRVTGADTFAFGAVNLASTSAVTGALTCPNGGTGTNTAQGATWTPTVTAQTPGGTPPTTVTTNANYSVSCGKVIAQFRITITAAGTGTGYLKVTLPGTIAATQRGNCYGVDDAVTGKALVGTLDTTGGLMRMYDGTTPIITGQSVNATCIFDY